MSNNQQMKIQQVKVAELLPNPANVRTHTPEQIEMLKASIVKFGWRVPIVANKNTMIIEAGHARLQAAQELGLAEVPCHLVDDDALTATQFGLAENRLAELASYDYPALIETLEALKAEDALDNALGWAEEEIERLKAEVWAESAAGKGDDFDPEAALEQNPELAERVELGQVWQLGRHLLRCGDSLTDGWLWQNEYDLLWLDPPWDMEAEQQAAVATASINKVRRFALIGIGTAWHCAIVQMIKAGLVFQTDLVWDRNCSRNTAGNESLPQAYYHCITLMRNAKADKLYYNEEAALKILGIEDQKRLHTLFRMTYWPEKGFGHAKPMKLMEMLIALLVPLGGKLADPFCGSGTSIAAAERQGRICYGQELDAAVCAVAIARWEAETGSQAVLLEGGNA